VSSQHKVAPNETTTGGYAMVNASLDYHPFAANPEMTISLQANNLFDVNARRHSSDLKDYAPLAGRDIRLTARFGFQKQKRGPAKGSRASLDARLGSEARGGK
jgi:iron complex outermembrane receptor protein